MWLVSMIGEKIDELCLRKRKSGFVSVVRAPSATLFRSRYDPVHYGLTIQLA
jgi:hypothetical protein